MPRQALRRSKRIATKRPNATRARNRIKTRTALDIYVHPDAAITGGQPEYNGEGELLTSHDAFGDFRVSKDFLVSAEDAQKYIVIQKVTKRTRVKIGRQVLNTTEEILEFTDNLVDNTCDSYYEYFDIKPDGESVNYDKFTNGAIAKYNNKNQVLDTEDAGFVFTIGTIIQEGTSVCLRRGCAECDAILALPWHTGINTPANGLPYLSYNSDNEKLLAHAFSGVHSNIIVHQVNVIWDKSKLNAGCPISRVSNFVNGVAI